MDMIEVKIQHTYDPDGPGGWMHDIGPWMMDHGMTGPDDWEFDFVGEENETFYLIRIHPKFKDVATLLLLRWG